MARPSRRRRRAGTERTAASTDGSGGLIGQIGLFETANGLPHGPAAIVLGIVAVLVMYPIGRLVRMLRRR